MLVVGLDGHLIRRLDAGKASLPPSARTALVAWTPARRGCTADFEERRMAMPCRMGRATGLTPNKARALLGRFLFSGEEAEKPIAFYLASADAAAGEQVFKKCTACHNADQGGANALGPNLWDVLGEPVGKGKGFPFSSALSGVSGTWNWDNMSEWLKSPKKFAPGTKMTFAGLSNPQDRANVIAFLNAHSDSPLPLPAAPAEEASAPKDDKAAATTGTGPEQPGPQKAENEPAADLKAGGGDAKPGAGPN